MTACETELTTSATSAVVCSGVYSNWTVITFELGNAALPSLLW